MRLNLRTYRSEKRFKRLASAIRKARRYYSERVDVQTDPSLGVGSNTFRAFRGVKRPSAAYREWARRLYRTRRFKKAVLAARSRDGFERLHRWLSQSLERHWRRKYRKPLLLAHRYKLVDLFIKRLCRFQLSDSRMNTRLVANGHVPLDSSVFKALDRLFSGILLTEGRAMRHIKSERAYRFYQDIFRSIMYRLRAPPLYFDYYAWNLEKDA